MDNATTPLTFVIGAGTATPGAGEVTVSTADPAVATFFAGDIIAADVVNFQYTPRNGVVGVCDVVPDADEKLFVVLGMGI